MSQTSVKLLISFETLLESLATLNLKEKRRLWTWLGEQITQAQTRENRAAYASSNLETRERITPQDIVEQLKKLTPTERLAVVETALHLVYEDLLQMGQGRLSSVEQKRQLAVAAKALLSDYTTDDELTGFTALDGEEFYESGRNLAY